MNIEAKLSEKPKDIYTMYYIHNTMLKIHNTTQDKILKLLLSNKQKEFTIREISKNVCIDYKTVHIVVKRLMKSNVIKGKKAGQTILCSINQKEFNQDIFRAEFIRKEEILNNKNIAVLYKRIKEDVKEPFFVLLLFGSHAAGKQRKGSDIDLMLITDNKEISKKIRHIISLTPLDVHLADFTSKEFLSMLKTTEFNVGKEAANNNIILFGIENYYGLLQNA